MAYYGVSIDPESVKLPKMKKLNLEAEIRKAVKEYIDSLIAERSKAGRGMAIGSKELMEAARSASTKVNAQELTKSYLKPALQLVREVQPTETTVNDEANTTYLNAEFHYDREVHPPETPKPSDRRGRSSSKSAGNRPKNEPHWLTWRTGNTPSVTSERQPCSNRADPCRSRTTPADVLDLSDPQMRPASVVPRINTPSASKSHPSGYRLATPAPSIPNTPTPQRVDTPASLTADHRDYLADRQVAPVDIVLKPKTPQNPAYMPALKAWITNANDYERDVAYNLMHVLSTGEPPIARHRTRPRTAVPGLTKLPVSTKRNLPKTAGVRTSVPAYWQQIYKDPRHEQYIVNNMAKALERKEPNLTLEVVDDSRPVMRYKYSMAPQYGPIHEGACFMDAQRPYRGSYVINPEWISELKQTEKHPPQMACSGSRAMKYCSH